MSSWALYKERTRSVDYMVEERREALMLTLSTFSGFVCGGGGILGNCVKGHKLAMLEEPGFCLH